MLAMGHVVSVLVCAHWSSETCDDCPYFTFHTTSSKGPSAIRGMATALKGKVNEVRAEADRHRLDEETAKCSK